MKVSEYTEKKSDYKIGDLLKIIAILRGEKGCPWDKEQTHKSIRKNLLEEAYEVVEAIDEDDKNGIKEELGDLLMQIVFHADIEREEGNFDFDDVCCEVCKKLIIRHPHVFGGSDVKNKKEVLENWDKIKREQKNQSRVSDSLKSVPKLLPQLTKAQKIESRVKKGGFKVEDIIEDRGLIKGKINNRDIGDILFYITNKATEEGIDCEEALEMANKKFIEKFEKFEKKFDM